MPANGPEIRDDTLRLVFAAEEERFIAERQKDSTLMTGVTAPLAAVCWFLLLSGWDSLPAMVVLVLIFAAPALLATAIAAVADVLRYRRYAADLRAFLAHYNRL